MPNVQWPEWGAACIDCKGLVGLWKQCGAAWRDEGEGRERSETSTCVHGGWNRAINGSSKKLLGGGIIVKPPLQ